MRMFIDIIKQKNTIVIVLFIACVVVAYFNIFHSYYVQFLMLYFPLRRMCRLQLVFSLIDDIKSHLSGLQFLPLICSQESDYDFYRSICTA